jgi:hypothetical protein
MDISNIINFGISSVISIMSIIGINKESLIFKFNESEKELNTDINISTNTTNTNTTTTNTTTNITTTNTNTTSTNNYNFSYLDNSGYGQFYFIYSIDE